VAPELAACMARAAALQVAIESLRAAARDDDPLAIACEPEGTRCDHWAAIVKGRQARAKGAQ